MNVIILWALATLILIVFLVREGWKKLPRWHRWYVITAAIVTPLTVVLIDMNLPIPGPAPGTFLYVIGSAIAPAIGAGLFIAWSVTVYWGIAVGVQQTWFLYKKRVERVRSLSIPPVQSSEFEKARSQTMTVTTDSCTNCGKLLRPNANFCTYCSKSIHIENLCTNCRAVLRSDANFCVRCGKSISEQ